MKQIIFALGGIILAAFLWWTIEPLLGDDVVDEQIAVDIEPVTNQTETTDEEAVSQTPDNSNDKEITDTAVQTQLYQGSFVDADPSHRASGTVYISGNDLSLVDFDSTNVPDARVYLANDVDARDYVDLGALKGNVGNQNYRIPEEIDAADYSHVLIWCRAFSVLVGSAEIR